MSEAQQLDSHRLFSLLRPEQVNALSDVAERMAVEAGETVYRCGDRVDALYVVLEGQVSLRAPGPRGTSVLIDEATPGAIFGHCGCLEREAYALDAVCTENARLLAIETGALKKLMDEDLVMGYSLQALISRVYFRRYLETMKKLQSIVLSMPLA
jgi:CRP-like cAMP-binding protein